MDQITVTLSLQSAFSMAMGLIAEDERRGVLMSLLADRVDSEG